MVPGAVGGAEPDLQPAGGSESGRADRHRGAGRGADGRHRSARGAAHRVSLQRRTAVPAGAAAERGGGGATDR